MEGNCLNFLKMNSLKKRIFFLSILLLLITSFMFIAIPSNAILLNNFSPVDSMIAEDNMMPRELYRDNLTGNSIYLEDDIIRSGNTLFIKNSWLFLIVNWYDLHICNISNI